MQRVRHAKKSRTAWALIVALALVGTACGGDDDDDEGASSETTTEETSGEGEPGELKTDYGVTDEVIRLGLLTDLSGPFSALAKDIALAQQVYWEKVNDAGGIAGRKIELVIEDEKYDPVTHKQKFQAYKAKDANGVVMMAQSIGSPHNAAINAELKAEHMIAIPLTWYSGWAEVEYGKNVFEAYTNYCFEAMNTLEYFSTEQAVKKVAIISFPGEYGQDGAKGAKLGAEALGMEVVYDGEGKVTPPSATNPNPDNTAVVNAIVAAKPDVVHATINPATLAVLMGGASQKGYKGKWTGNSPTYTPTLLKSDIAPLLDATYWAPTYTVALGTNVPGMQAMIDAIKEKRPTALASDAYVYGWTEAQIAETILKQAAENGDMTRAGVEKAAFEIDKVDFGGLAPAQTWKGDPDDYIVRESYIFKPKAALYKEGPIGTGHTGSELVKGPFASKAATEYKFTEKGACFPHS